MMVYPATALSYLILQGLDLPSIEFPYLGARGLVGIVMLTHIFFATLFVGYAIGSPLLQAWSVRTGNPRFERLAHSMARFNLLTFSVGATWAVMFLVVLVGLYPRVAAALFTHFFWFFPVAAMVSMLLTGLATRRRTLEHWERQALRRRFGCQGQHRNIHQSSRRRLCASTVPRIDRSPRSPASWASRQKPSGTG